MKPYKQQKIDDKTFIRIFEQDVDDSELVWHKDYENRFIKIIENTNWKIQFDNQLPFLLSDDFIIEKETYHRIIKGNGRLVVQITEY